MIPSSIICENSERAIVKRSGGSLQVRANTGGPEV